MERCSVSVFAAVGSVGVLGPEGFRFNLTDCKQVHLRVLLNHRVIHHNPMFHMGKTVLLKEKMQRDLLNPGAAEAMMGAWKPASQNWRPTSNTSVLTW